MNTSGRNFPHQKNGTEPSTVHTRLATGRLRTDPVAGEPLRHLPTLVMQESLACVHKWRPQNHGFRDTRL